jgi:integrase
MNESTQEISPLRQRMLEDMRLRKLAPHTQASYVRAVRKLAGYLRRPPDTATVEDLRNFQLHLVDQGTSPITLNATITGLKFFFDVTLDRSELMSKMKPVHVPRTLPVVLSREEVSALIAAVRNLKHQTALSIAQPHNPQDADVILVTEYKNWAALDHLGSKLDQVSAKIEGSVEKANQSEVDRAKIRTVLGSDTAQVAELK